MNYYNMICMIIIRNPQAKEKWQRMLRSSGSRYAWPNMAQRVSLCHPILLVPYCARKSWDGTAALPLRLAARPLLN